MRAIQKGRAPERADGRAAVVRRAPTERVGEVLAEERVRALSAEGDSNEIEATSGGLKPLTLKQRLILADAAAVLTGLLAAIWWQDVVRPGAISTWGHLKLSVLSFPVWMVVLGLNKMYLARAVARPSEELRRILHSAVVSIGITVSIAFAVQFTQMSRLWALSVIVLVPLLLIIERFIARMIFNRMRRDGRLTRRILIVGTDSEAIGLMHATKRRPELGYEVVGFVGPDDLGPREGVEVLGGIDDVEHVLVETGATGVMLSLSSLDGDRLNRLTRGLTDAGYHVALSSGLRDIDVVRFRPQDVAGRTLVYVEPTVRHGWRAYAKRTFDITVAGLGLLFSLPILVVAAVAIRLDSAGPIVFSQVRVGKDGKLFRIHKLRTMVPDAEAKRHELQAHNEADGPLFKMAADPRITRVGGLLRKLSIDELPQFVNVLRGEMSLIGPRPALPTEVEEWDTDLHERLRVLPGITGLWQVSGRSDTNFDEYKRLDLFYVDNWSLTHDVRIVLRTFGVVLASRGAR